MYKRRSLIVVATHFNCQTSNNNNKLLVASRDYIERMGYNKRNAGGVSLHANTTTDTNNRTRTATIFLPFPSYSYS